MSVGNADLVQYEKGHLDALTRKKITPSCIERNSIKYYERTFELASDATGDYIIAEQEDKGQRS